MTTDLLRASLVLLLLVGCDGETEGTDGGAPGTDAGAASDAGGGGIDAGSGGDDAGSTGDDAGAGGTDAGGDGSDAGAPGDAGPLACEADLECPGYATALAAAPRGATSLDNCVVQLHQADCCGARNAYGINHAARTELCPAETACVAAYPSPATCTDDTITTDTGDTTTDVANIRVRIVDPTPCSFDSSVTCYTCETFVCESGPCRSEPGVAGGCG